MTEQDVNLLGPAQIRELARGLDLRPTKTWGQNFVHDAGTVRKIVRSADITAGEHVLEVGPGLGSLTLGLLEVGAAVTAVEIDPRLAEQLPLTVRTFAPTVSNRLTVINEDALHVTDVGEPTALVANLPYNVAVPVLLTLLARVPSLQRIVVMVQAEVADRIAAAPGSKIYGVPSVKAAWYASARRTITIGRSVFWPVPNVDSALVELIRRDLPETTAPRDLVFRVIDAAFGQRRKTLRTALAGLAGSPARAEEALRAAGIEHTLRGERLTVTEFARIAEALDALPDAKDGES